ncbi:Glycosyl transferases group 1 [Lachnospiraceae bacterium]|nr:Glycosyl transferases group 1 [Lachnospiraceae bacterium]
MDDNLDMVDIYNELLEAREVIVQQRQEIADIKGSLSWKITKPYRVAVGLLKKGYHKLKKYTIFGFTAFVNCFRWIGQYGVKEGLKLIREKVVSKIQAKKKLAKIHTIVNETDCWKEFEDWIESIPHEFIDIFSVPMGWNTKLFQRFQHISLNVGKINGIAVYGAHPSVDKDVDLYKIISPKLCLVNLENPQVKQKMFEILDKRKELKYIRIQSIDLATTIEEVNRYIYKGYYIVYEYIDELTPQITGSVPQFVYERHEKLLKNKNVIVTATSDKLFKQALEIRKSKTNIIVSTNGVDYDYWHDTRGDADPPEDIKEIVEQGKIIVGYHGALARWIDYDALKAIADTDRYSLLLIGFEHDDSLKNSGILEYSNVYFLGSKPYSELVKYAVWYDVAIMPFVLNNITLSVSPVKIFEYMALKKPIVSGALPECKKYGSCLIANTLDEYLEQLENAVQLIDDEKYMEVVSREAKENTWEAITKKVVNLVYAAREDQIKKLNNSKKEETIPDIYNTTLTDLYKSFYMDEVLDISRNRKSVYYKELIQKTYKRQENDVKIIAYYLTQYHPDPHNEEWWGKGVTEWNNVTRAIPQFLGHYQPRIPGEMGYYDLRIKDNMKRQIELAKMYGIFGFSFYYYWFNGERLLEQPLEMFLADSDLDFPFSLCWANENWTKRFDGTNLDILMEQPTTVESYRNVIHDMVRFLNDPRYITVDGKKVITVYRPSLMPKVKEVLKYWRRVAEEKGVGKLYLIAVKENTVEIDWLSEGYDAVSEFHPGTLYKECTKINDTLVYARRDFSGEVYSYKDIVINKKYFNYSYPKLYRAVMPMWDNTARRNNKGMIFHESTPMLYKEWLMDVIHESYEKADTEDNIIFINAWNEWGEGAYLEPDRFYGYAYLNATKEAVEECREDILDMKGRMQ